MDDRTLSADIGNLTAADNSGQPVYVKRKIAFGVDGQATDVSTLNPFPVTGTFSPSAPDGFSNFGQSTPKVVTVTNLSTQLLDANPNRVFVRITNNSTSRIYIQYGIDAVYGRGLPLGTNSSLIISKGELFTGIINAISTTSVDIDVIEGIV